MGELAQVQPRGLDLVLWFLPPIKLNYTKQRAKPEWIEECEVIDTN
jgi:hypothetical protein